MNLKTIFCSFSLYIVAVLMANGQHPIVPKYKTTQILVSSDELDTESYLAFPSILRLNPNEILISFKRGSKHGQDKEARLEMLHFDTKNNEIIEQKSLAADPGLVHQMGEWVRFPDGSIGLYIDTQHTGHDNDNYRAGLREVRVQNTSQGFDVSPTQLAPKVNGREYGYAFDFINEGQITYMLVMGFGYRPGEKWSVDVVQSKDNGRSWTLVRDLTEEFGGHRINESAFIPWEDGFVVTTREYGPNQRIYLTDADFKFIKEHNLSSEYDFMESHIGRPRLFSKDGHIYLLGRNWRTEEGQERKMELGLFKIDPGTLKVKQWVVLDNSDRADITDGYYAVPYFQEKEGVTFFNVINYKGANRENPNIERYEFLWDEIR
ncbi:hypothetical protein SAMN04488057_12117 [Cyclobacterium lianum]|uniref:BNR repeat-containing family member n=2 Tax=Cyclobacterium lianum TaxID=388280 RepID=A0A1M7QPG6_9BACT|nr:hypothetical protein SAMN04488057_12117 [Cyclobacterium lianum]